MPEQLSFAGFETEALPTDSVFFAVFPDDKAAARIARIAQRLRDKHRLTGRPHAARRLHISLHYVAAHVPPNVLAKANEAVSTIATPPFRIAFDHVKSLPGNGRDKPLVLCGSDGVAGLVMFQHQLGQAMEQAGLGRWIGPSWFPHLTLLYDARAIKEQRIEPVSWIVRDFVLVHSQLGRARHNSLARWPLRG